MNSFVFETGLLHLLLFFFFYESQTFGMETCRPPEPPQLISDFGTFGPVFEVKGQPSCCVLCNRDPKRLKDGSDLEQSSLAGH